MSRFEAYLVHLSTLLVGGTGIVYAAMLYLMEPIDEFAITHHPLQPHAQHAHIWFAPVLVFGIGMIWRQHVWTHYRGKVTPRRSSGLLMLATVAPMIVSGYLIQTSSGGAWQTAWITIHLTTSLLFLIAYGAHLLAALRRREPKVSGRPTAAADPGGTPV